MKIYTKTGDRGETSLFGGTRLPKSHVQVEAYGTIDELSSILGWIVSAKIKKEDARFLTTIQKDLYKIMAVLSGGSSPLDKLADHIALFEKRIDELDKTLPTLKQFVLPQGSEESARFHMARAVCRRAERNLVELFLDENTKKVFDQSSTQVISQYVNRLSDLLFMLARSYTEQDSVVYTK